MFNQLCLRDYGMAGSVPGTETMTTFLPANSLSASNSVGLPQTVGSSSVMGACLGFHVSNRYARQLVADKNRSWVKQKEASEGR